MYELRSFTVVAELPDELAGLESLAKNLRYLWTPEVRLLFSRLDPVAWPAVRGNATAFLAGLNPESLRAAAADPAYVRAVADAAEELKTHLEAERIPPETAYFSMEYGLGECIPLYAGGLGILSGDHVKSASDLGLSLTAVGLLYRQGYFHQRLDEAGRQEEAYAEIDTAQWPLHPVMDPENPESRLVVELPWPDRLLKVQAWRLDVGRVPLFLLDTRRMDNTPADRRLTDRLYGGDREYRLQQEMVLGIGGVRLLHQLGVDPPVLHLNEGHSAFAPFERIRLLMKESGLTRREAQQLVFRTGVFTTHTPVPAGNDEFDPGLILRYLGVFASGLNMAPEEFLNCGRVHQGDGREGFSMTVAAMRHSSRVNAVSRLHGRVSRRMWRNMWPGVPEREVPIHALTNGIHLRTWMAPEIDALLGRHLKRDWPERQRDPDFWSGVGKIPSAQLWDARNVARNRMVEGLRLRRAATLKRNGAPEHRILAAGRILDPGCLTIGLARRFATYKRSNLILQDQARILGLLRHAATPIQLLFAGKAHPLDGEGKNIIQQIQRFIRDNELQNRIVFVEDYDMEVARLLVQGVDVWLNTPLRPLEACGTSGMKAAAGGGLNLSVLDGWWDEAYDGRNGWGLGGRRMEPDPAVQNAREGRELLDILESDVVPRFYNRDESGVPQEWVKMMRASLSTLPGQFNTHRMVSDYSRVYAAAAGDFNSMAGEGFSFLKEWTQWRDEMIAGFDAVRVLAVHMDTSRPFRSGERIDVSVEVDSGRIPSSQLDVSLLFRLVAPEPRPFTALKLDVPEGETGARVRFSGSLEVVEPGTYETTVRVTPHHAFLSGPYELFRAVWG